MEALTLFLVGLAEKLPWLALILGALGSLVVVGQAVVILTPSKKDDEFLDGLEKHSIFGTLLKAIKSFAPIQKR